MDRERGSLCPSGSHPGAGVPRGRARPDHRGGTLWCPVGRGSTPGRPAPVVRRRRWPTTGLALWSAMLLAVAVTPAIASAAPATTTSPSAPAPTTSPAVASASTVPAPVSAAASSGGTSPLKLVSQSASVVPGQHFDLQLRTADRGAVVGTARRDGHRLPLPVQRLGLRPVGELIRGSRRDAHHLHPVTPAGEWAPGMAGGGVDLSLPVSGGDSSTRPRPQASPSTSPRPAAQCRSYPSGVYPVRVQLVEHLHPPGRRRLHHPAHLHRRAGRHPATAGGPGPPGRDDRDPAATPPVGPTAGHRPAPSPPSVRGPPPAWPAWWPP